MVYGSRGGFKGTAKPKKKNLNDDTDSDEDSSLNKRGSSKKVKIHWSEIIRAHRLIHNLKGFV